MNYCNTMIIGFGPHAKRIYMHYLVKKEITPKCIIELEEKENETIEYLHQLGVAKEVITIDLLRN